MIVSVASGKGGTGKTTVAANLALALGGAMPVSFLDCDVEEPNAHLFLRPVLETSEQVALSVPVIDESKCTGCGTCVEVCAFHAVLSIGGHVITFPELCHGCGGCARFCPEGAISEIPKEIGVVETGWAMGLAGRIAFAQGRVNVGVALAPPVVKAVRSQVGLGRDRDRGRGVVIIDSPPGTSCPVVASVKGSDYCVLVTEPTPFGLNDLALAVDMVREVGVPFGVVVNRAGLGDDKVAGYCAQEGIPVLLEIPFDRRYAACYARGGQLVRDFPELGDALRGLWRRICAVAGTPSAGALSGEAAR